LNSPSASDKRSAAVAHGRPHAVALDHDAASDSPLVRLHLLGTMEASTIFGANVLPRSARAGAILAVVAMAAGKSVRRSRLAGLIWDRVPEEQARASLRKALAEVSRGFGDLFDQVIDAGRDHIALRKNTVWVDAAALQELDQVSPQHQAAEYQMCARGELLEGLDGISASLDSWLHAERQKFYNEVSLRLDRLLNDPARLGEGPHSRIQIARHLIAVDATNERAWQLLIKGLLDQGDRAQALRAYGRCVQSLRELLDAEPSEATKRLGASIRSAGGAGPPASQAPANQTSASQAPNRAAPSRPRLRVAVLPIAENGGRADPLLTTTLPLEVAAALARFRWFDAISPLSFGQGVAGKAAVSDRIKAMDLDYFIDFQVQRDAAAAFVLVRLNRVGETFDVVWDDRLDARTASSKGFNDLISRIVSRIDPVILLIESRRPYALERSGSNHLVMRAIPLMYSLVPDRYEEAGRLLTQALETEPKNAMAMAWLAFWWAFNLGQGWAKDPELAMAKVEKLCVEAINLDPLNAQALGIYGHICSFYHKDFERGQHHLEEALQINPNVSFLWALNAATLCYLGRPKKAIASLERYREVAPFDPFFKLFETIYVMAHLFDRDYEQAAKVGRRAVSVNPEFVNGYKPLIAALGHLGAKAEARKYLRELVAREPGFCIRRFVESYPFRQSRDRENYIKGLRLADVPEAIKT
jgi:DNA-binding SARP family transcriptional activator